MLWAVHSPPQCPILIRTRDCAVSHLYWSLRTDPSISGIDWPTSEPAVQDPISESACQTLLCLRVIVLASPNGAESNQLSAAHAELHVLSSSG